MSAFSNFFGFREKLESGSLFGVGGLRNFVDFFFFVWALRLCRQALRHSVLRTTALRFAYNP